MKTSRDLTWNDRTAFREIFLLHAPPGGARTLREFGRYMYETLVEGASEPGVPARVRAVAEDLRVSAQTLAGVAATRVEEGLPPEAAALAMKAKSWARELSELVRAIESAAAGGRGAE